MPLLSHTPRRPASCRFSMGPPTIHVHIQIHIQWPKTGTNLFLLAARQLLPRGGLGLLLLRELLLVLHVRLFAKIRRERASVYVYA